MAVAGGGGGGGGGALHPKLDKELNISFFWIITVF